MIATALLCFAFLQADAPWIANIRVSTDEPWDTLNQGESCFAVWGDSIFSVCNTAERGTVPIAPYAYSFNSGMTFTQIPFTDLTSGITWHTDPVIGVDDSGHVHMLMQYSATLMKHYLSRDGGQTWCDTTQVNPIMGVDKPWMVVNRNEIYIAYQKPSGDSTGIWFAKSTDYGQSFMADRIWNRRYIAALGMDENENLHLMLVALGYGVYYRKSTDHGDTWLPEVNLGNWSHDPSYGDRAPINSITACGNIVFGTWVNNATGGWNIMGVRSADSGTTWCAPFVVNDITTGGQCKGWAHFDAYGGLHVIYYHTPDWPTSVSSIFELRYQYSADSGATFNPSIRVSDTTFVSHADFMGEYHICLSDSQYLYAIWTDGRNGDDNDLYFSKALLSELSVKEGPAFLAQHQQILRTPTIWRGNVALEIQRNALLLDIKIYNVAGQLVGNIYHGEVSSGLTLKLNSNDFPKGVIFLRASCEDKHEVIKIVNLGVQ